MDSDARLIATIRKNGRQEFRVQLRTFKRHRGLDLRVFESNGIGMDKTPQGLSMKAEMIRPIINALQDAERVAIEEGLLTESESV